MLNWLSLKIFLGERQHIIAKSQTEKVMDE